jgi:hypothetical protein
MTVHLLSGLPFYTSLVISLAAPTIISGPEEGLHTPEGCGAREKNQKATRATVEAPVLVCAGSFTRVYSLPCAHRINGSIKQNQPISLTDIH